MYDFVKGKGAWITKQVKQFKEVQPYKQSEREYVSGESFRYLGKQYRLKVQEAEEEEEIVKYFRGFIYLIVKDRHNFGRKAKLMDEWYREKAYRTFQQLLDKLYPLLKSTALESL
ncbi:YgjP-like metallopeptidase domain-containing protein [Bacillus sp. N9]